ncbi:MAG: hypothetical protein EOP35_24135, partial [Rubrivivax sp.]
MCAEQPGVRDDRREPAGDRRRDAGVARLHRADRLSRLPRVAAQRGKLSAQRGHGRGPRAVHGVFQPAPGGAVLHLRDLRRAAGAGLRGLPVTPVRATAPAGTVAPGGVPGALRLWPLFLGLALLAALWLGPLPERSRGSFAAHMVVHMGIVAVAAPLLVLGLSRLWPAALKGVPPKLALAASFAEFALVWGWHAPALHNAARVSAPLFLAEQASFLGAGLFVWMTALGAAS